VASVGLPVIPPQPGFDPSLTLGRQANVLADFFVGVHAAVMGWGIITRDARCYRNYFPRVPLVLPTTANR
jgi:hypothetical protein